MNESWNLDIFSSLALAEVTDTPVVKSLSKIRQERLKHLGQLITTEIAIS
jgi:hypothetical protein